VRGALEKVPGVTKIDIAAGQKDFTVHYDATKIKPADLVAKLVAAGETGAKVKA